MLMSIKTERRQLICGRDTAVIPAQAGIQTAVTFLDPRLRGDDDILS